MNTACIIAACAAGARASKQSDSHSTQYFTEGFEIYYRVKLRKYYYFEAMTLISHIGEYFTGSIYAPIMTPYYKPVKVPAKTMAIEHTFSVAASKCPNGIDQYIKDNLDRFSSSSIWLENDKKVINKYVNELNRELDIDLDPTSLTYTSQFCWEVC